MTKEMSKATRRRYNIGEFHSKYFVGSGVDIGCGPDSLSNHRMFFPQLEIVRGWDKEDGDAQLMSTVGDDVFDFAVSSHCLEHLHDPFEGLKNWVRIVKPGGYIIFVVPDEDLYEMGVFPSRFNSDHKWTFTIYKKESFHERSINIFKLIESLGNVQPLKIELLTDMYDYIKQKRQIDQTLNQSGPECGIEVILRKL